MNVRPTSNPIPLHRQRLPMLRFLTCAMLLVMFSDGSSAIAMTTAQTDQMVTKSADNQSNDVAAPAERDGKQQSKPPTAANAKPAKASGISLLNLLTQGGWFMLPLLLLSVLVVTIGIERLLALRRDKIFPPKLIDRLAELTQADGGLDPRRAYQSCQHYPSSASYIFRSMLVKVGRPQAELESAVSEAAQREATRLARSGSWLTLAAAIAPLIGLLGTVWGITQAFYDTTQLVVGQNRAEALAGGIYTALVTTMAGLLIAIPAAILSHYFENRIVQLLNEIEELCFNLLPQFERYEGQLRFTTGVPADEDMVVEPDTVFDDPDQDLFSDYPPIPLPPVAR